MDELIQRLEQNLLGRCVMIERREGDWAGNIDGGGVVSLGVPWRIVAQGRIAFADEDDGQKFGLPSPVDGEVEANRLLAGKPIIGITIDDETGDLTVMFEGNLRLDAFNNSAGYEGWQIDLPPDLGGMWVIALGGGEISVFV
ncbi:hypothetical protein [Croceibacterium salegens]|nr:hypothetical protein [Croceibacterium salegens]